MVDGYTYGLLYMLIVNETDEIIAACEMEI